MSGTGRVSAVERLDPSVVNYSEHVQTSNFPLAAVWSRREFNSHRPTLRDGRPSRRIGSGGLNWALLGRSQYTVAEW